MTIAMLLPGAAKLSPSAIARGRFLSAVAAFFLEMARWPSLDEVERVLEDRDEPINARLGMQRLGRKFGRQDGPGRVVLTVRGLHQVRPKDPVLLGFQYGLDLMVRRYRDGAWDVKPTLTRDELFSGASLTDKQALCVMALIESESLAVLDDARVTATIGAEVRKFRSVETIPGYIEKRSLLECRRRVGQAHDKLCAAVRALFRGRALVLLAISTTAILLAALILWAGGKFFPIDEERSPGKSPPGSTAPKAPPRRVQAALPQVLPTAAQPTLTPLEWGQSRLGQVHRAFGRGLVEWLPELTGYS